MRFAGSKIIQILPVSYVFLIVVTYVGIADGVNLSPFEDAKNK